ncbi:helix-turn-helix transcriptional regulator [Streptomyces sp. NPDC006798]|uniref:helix-turn-helix transcriptional regulator n=1 Tax=Streptomyces sp. NPDC006798 TaxID=3155462 RepID=UPI0033C0CD22
MQQSLLDVMSAFLAQCPDAAEARRADSGGGEAVGGAVGGAGRVTLRDIRSFIETRLADHDLTPQIVADHHHISLSTLYALFRDQEEEGVAAWIRRRRLERSRADLAVVNRRQQPIHAIAVRWGFTDGAAFSRAFRQAYGISPRAFRQRAGAGDR